MGPSKNLYLTQIKNVHFLAFGQTYWKVQFSKMLFYLEDIKRHASFSKAHKNIKNIGKTCWLQTINGHCKIIISLCLVK